MVTYFQNKNAALDSGSYNLSADSFLLHQYILAEYSWYPGTNGNQMVTMFLSYLAIEITTRCWGHGFGIWYHSLLLHIAQKEASIISKY